MTTGQFSAFPPSKFLDPPLSATTFVNWPKSRHRAREHGKDRKSPVGARSMPTWAAIKQAIHADHPRTVARCPIIALSIRKMPIIRCTKLNTTRTAPTRLHFIGPPRSIGMQRSPCTETELMEFSATIASDSIANWTAREYRYSLELIYLYCNKVWQSVAVTGII